MRLFLIIALLLLSSPLLAGDLLAAIERQSSTGQSGDEHTPAGAEPVRPGLLTGMDIFAAVDQYAKERNYVRAGWHMVGVHETIPVLSRHLEISHGFTSEQLKGFNLNTLKWIHDAAHEGRLSSERATVAPRRPTTYLPAARGRWVQQCGPSGCRWVWQSF